MEFFDILVPYLYTMGYFMATKEESSLDVDVDASPLLSHWPTITKYFSICEYALYIHGVLPPTKKVFADLALQYNEIHGPFIWTPLSALQLNCF